MQINAFYWLSINTAMSQRANCNSRTRAKSTAGRHSHREPVIVNIYEIRWINDVTSSIGIGIYHSGIEIYGIEYGFGGHPYDTSGIFKIPARTFCELCEDFNFKERIVLGYTDYKCSEIRRIIKDLGRTFIGKKYHLMKNNCNHFSDYFSNMLCNKSIPSYVNRLAKFSCIVPFLQNFLPKNWLTPHSTLEHCHRHRQQHEDNETSDS